MRVAGKRALRWRFLCHSAKCLGATRLPRSFSSYLTNRLQSWQRTVDALRATVPAASVPPRAITVGIGEKTLEGKSGVTTPQSILSEDAEVRKALGNSTVVAALVNGRAWDLKRPLETDATLEFVDFNHPAGREVLWHSSAHVLGQALEQLTPDLRVFLADGPALDEGFYYDCQLVGPNGEQVTLSAEELKKVEEIANKIISEKQPFERLVVSKAQALELFGENRFKREIIEALPEGEEITVYRCGMLVDLCRGPHIPHTGYIKAFAITGVSNALWRGQNTPENTVQRVYGISFPDKAMLKEWKARKEEAAKRDHRVLGKKYELFMFHEYSPGSAFFLPHGTRVYNRLVDFIRQQYRERGYQEVRTPLIFHKKLWQTSGHWDNYREDMFLLDPTCTGDAGEQGDGPSYGLKPMNCPGHCLIFANKLRSYRDLPLRLADFSDLHRNEVSGALTGLTRVRRFAQDDAHIFCTPEQVPQEIKECLKFVSDVYGVFGFSFKLRLSTRPDKFIGDIELWNQAEAALEQALNESGHEWTLNPGDGAFYGPKIDLAVTDALGRQHQCATIQLDFQLPRRFGLTYQGPDDKPTAPVMIHRAILGSGRADLDGTIDLEMWRSLRSLDD